MINEVADFFLLQKKQDFIQFPEKNNVLQICRFFMNISGEVILRFFLGVDEFLYFDEKNKIFLSQELQQLAIELGEVILDPGTILRSNFLPKNYWANKNLSFLMSSRQKKLVKRFT